MRAITDMLWMFFGFFVFLISEMMPITRLIMLQWIGIFLMFLSPIMYVYHLKITRTYELFNKLGRNRALMPFLRRDHIIVPLTGNRVYSGESFLDVAGVGLIEDLGAGTVYSWGDKKIRFAMENISYTPDPQYWNLTAEYAKLGFTNADDLYDALMGNNLELMASSYLKMTDDKPPRGAEKLVKEIVENKPIKKIPFTPHNNKDSIHDKIDKMLGSGGYDS